MDLVNEFRVSVSVDQVWAVLTDLERIAPCMPGAELQEVDGEEYRGIVKVKVGPISAQYQGTAKIVEKDDELHRAVLRAAPRRVAVRERGTPLGDAACSKGLYGQRSATVRAEGR